MTDMVSADDIERIVGCKRHPWAHYGRSISTEQRVYILHSQDCKNSGIDLRDCLYSTALERGIDLNLWSGFEDRVILLIISIISGKLLPRKDSAYEPLH